MNYAINLLKRWLKNFEQVYEDFVINGDLSDKSIQAKINRTKANQLKEAIKKLQDE